MPVVLRPLPPRYFGFPRCDKRFPFVGVFPQMAHFWPMRIYLQFVEINLETGKYSRHDDECKGQLEANQGPYASHYQFRNPLRNGRFRIDSETAVGVSEQTAGGLVRGKTGSPVPSIRLANSWPRRASRLDAKLG